jgi:hypothetical protein
MVFTGKRLSGQSRRQSPMRGRNSAMVLALVAFLGVSAYELKHFAGAVAQLPPVAWRKPWEGIERYEPAPEYRAARAVYPYSVVPGGVQSESEVAASMAKDLVVAGHYRDIAPERLHATRLNAPVDVYASYRTANSVHWTSHTIRVPKGELILSDGTNLIRARCGNRLTFAPRPPEQAASTLPHGAIPESPDVTPVEPPELVFEHGISPVLAPPGQTKTGLPAPPLSEESPTSESAHFWPPATEPPNWCCGPGGFPGSWQPVHPGRPGRPEPRPPGIPEPATGLLLGTGAFVMLITRACRVYR